MSPTEFEAAWETESYGNDFFILNVPSAFQLYVHLADYSAANGLADRYPEEFSTLGLRAWKHAVEGLTSNANRAESFAAAAEMFAADVSPSREELAKRGSWSGINVQVWAPYFRVRQLLAEAVEKPEALVAKLKEASVVLPPTQSGFHHPTVERTAILVHALESILNGKDVGGVRTAIKTYEREATLTGPAEEDELSLRFLALVAESLEGFAANPAQEVTSGRLREALAILDRLPLFEQGFAGAVEPELGKVAVESVIGPVRTWVYRALEAITDEPVLQRVLLRLSQASLPLHAQVLHGPVEFGKDVVVLEKAAETNVLKMYQVKVGDIARPGWRAVQPQLEEMFLVDVPATVVPAAEPFVREGILFFTGHVHPLTAPVVVGWIGEQAERLGRRFVLMDLDDIVGWIERDNLIAEFRLALQDEGLA